jgi:hypothetical protein
MPEHVITPAEYRYYVADLLTNNVLGEIPFTNVSFERSLSKAGSFSGTIPVIDATKAYNLYENTLPGKTALYILRNGVCVWGGIIWARQYNPLQKTLIVDGNEYISYFYHRAIWQTLYYGSEGVYVSKYKALSGVATLYTNVAHNFVIGEIVRVRSLNPAINGDHVITSVPSTASFTFSVSNSIILDLSPSDTGLARTIVDTYDLARDLIGFMNDDFSNLSFQNDTIKPASDLQYSISNKSMTSGLATLTTTIPHDLILGQQIHVVDVDAAIDDYQIINAIPSASTFTVDTGGTGNISSMAVTPYTSYDITSAGILSTSLKLNSFQATNNVVTITASAAHGLVVGDYIKISNVSNVVSTGKTGTWTSASNTMTVDNSTNVFIGMSVYATGISNSAVVTAVSGTTITMSMPAEAAGSGAVNFAYQARLNGGFYISAVPSQTTFSYETTVVDLPLTAITATAGDTVYTFTSGTNGFLVQNTRVSDTTNPYLFFNKGVTYTIINNSGKHLWIQSSGDGYGAGKAYSTGVTNNGAASGTITFTVPINAPSILYFQAQEANNFAGSISISDLGTATYRSITCTTSAPHGLTVGKSAVIENIGADYNGTHRVSSIPNSTTFKCNSISILDQAVEAVFGGSVSWGARATAGTYGSYTGNSDSGIQATTDLSGKYIGVSQQIYRGSDLRSIGEVLEEFSKDLNGFEYRIDCDFDQATGKFNRTFTFVPFIPPTQKIQVINKILTSNIATLTTLTAHGLVEGEDTVVTGVGLGFDGNQTVISTPTPTTFTFSSYHVDVPSTATSGYIGLVHSLKTLGADRFVFEFPGNVLEFNISETAENSATRMWVAGNSDGLDNTASQPYAASTSTDMLNNGWPILDQVESKNDTITTAYGESALYSYAKEFAGEARPTEGTFTIVVNGSIGPYVGDFLPGYWCSIIIDDEFVKMRLANDLEPRSDLIVRKIVGYKVTVPDSSTFPEKVALELISEWKEDRRIAVLKITV